MCNLDLYENSILFLYNYLNHLKVKVTKLFHSKAFKANKVLGTHQTEMLMTNRYNT